jgi:regulator of protease activity HflC (stomatin/prohibitin superfamily)
MAANKDIFDNDGDGDPGKPFWFKYAAAGGGLLLALAVVLMINPFTTVDSGYVGVKTWFSAPEEATLQPGLHLLVPFVESVHEISVQPVTASTTETASTSDQQDVSTGVAVTLSVDPAAAVNLYQNYRGVDTFDANILAPIVSNDTKAVTADYNAQELINKRETVRSQIETAIRADVAQYGVVVIQGVNITDFHYSDDYNAAISAKQVAQQQALQEQYTLQGVQIRAQQQVAQAEAAAEATVDAAKGSAEATLLQAQADAQAYTLKQKTLTPLIVEQQMIEKWDGTMPTYTSSALPTTLFGVGGLKDAAPAAPTPGN